MGGGGAGGRARVPGACRVVGATSRLASRPGTGSCEVVMFTGIVEGQGTVAELRVAADGRLGGHVVQGHVDGLGRVLARDEVGDGAELRVGLDPALARYVVVKGSIAVDGVSLTVAGAGDDWFSVALVPHTLAVTTLGRRQPGDQVQLEVDVLAKYVERLLGPLLPAAAAEGGAGQ